MNGGECVILSVHTPSLLLERISVIFLRQVNLCMLQSGYYRLRSILLPGLAGDRRIRWHRIYMINGCKLKGDITFRRI